jgi:voltage-gated potassium channel Kch
MVLGALLVLGLVLGFVGFLQYDPRGQEWPTGAHLVTESAYRTLQLIRLGGAPPEPMPWTLEVARFLLPLVAAYSVLTAFLVIFWDRAQQLRLPFWRGHTVVVGLGDKGTAFARSVRAGGARVVAIERDPDCPGIAAARALRIPVVDGDGRDPAVLRAAGVHKARAVIAVTHDDSVNAETALAARSLAHGAQQSLHCLAHIADPDLSLLLEADELRNDGRTVTLDYFTVDAHAARILVSRYVVAAAPAAGVVVVGSSPLIEQFLDALDRERSAGRSGPGRVSLVGLDAPGIEAAHRLAARVPGLPAQVIDGSGESTAAWGARLCEQDTVVVVDGRNDGETLETALALRHPAAVAGAIVVACVRRSPGLEQALSDATREDLVAVEAYSVITATCTAELLDRGVHEQLAEAIHEQYVAQRHRDVGGPADLAPGDAAAVQPWEHLAETYRAANRAQAADMVRKLRSVGCDIATIAPVDGTPFAFTPAEVEQLAAEEHARWCAERTAEGFTYGAQRDPAAKRHPDLVDWRDLPEPEREKDREAVRAIPLLLSRAGLHVVRLRPAAARPAAPGINPAG